MNQNDSVSQVTRYGMDERVFISGWEVTFLNNVLTESVVNPVSASNGYRGLLTL
jgi:hypothetical protein